MKRSAALAPLSRDHHRALVVAARLRRATARTAAAAREAFLAFWREDGERHFREEEEHLLPAYAACAAPYDPLVARVLGDHVAIRALALRLRRTDAADVEMLRELGAALADHVRREERTLFSRIERALPAPELDRLLSLLGAAEEARAATAGDGERS